jgi:hypothetical protein
MPLTPDKELLVAALAGYQLKLTEIEARMADLRNRIAGVSGGAAPKKPASAPKKRRLSPEGRARIIAATKKRWAAVRAAKAAAAKKK